MQTADVARDRLKVFAWGARDAQNTPQEGPGVTERRRTPHLLVQLKAAEVTAAQAYRAAVAERAATMTEGALRAAIEFHLIAQEVMRDELLTRTIRTVGCTRCGAAGHYAKTCPQRLNVLG